jgi:hypothetical protein
MQLVHAVFEDYWQGKLLFCAGIVENDMKDDCEKRRPQRHALHAMLLMSP